MGRSRMRGLPSMTAGPSARQAAAVRKRAVVPELPVSRGCAGARRRPPQPRTRQGSLRLSTEQPSVRTPYLPGGIIHGDQRYWYENGADQASFGYENGRLEGVSTWWYESGYRQRQGAYHDGMQTGGWTEHAAAQRVQRRQAYHGGRNG